MSDTRTTVFGMYPNRDWAERGVDALKAAGFSNTDISILLPAGAGSGSFAYEKGTKAPEGVTTGGTSVAVIGGTLGWLPGIGSLVIPGAGAFIAAGPIKAALAGVGVGAPIDGIISVLGGMGIPEYEATRYEWCVRNGGSLLSVHTDNCDSMKRALEILERSEAQDISSTEH